jgi:hypothetical protein
VVDAQNCSEDWHARLLELAERFRSIAEAKLPGLEAPKSRWAGLAPTQQILLREKAIRDHRTKYEQAVTEAGTALIALSNSGVIADQRLKAFVAAHELSKYGGLIRKPAHLFALYVGGPRIELCDDQGRITQYETVGDGVPPQFRLAHPPDVSVAAEAMRQALGEPPFPDPEQCLRYFDYCMSLVKQIPAAMPASKTPLSEEKSLDLPAERAYRLYKWAIDQDPGLADAKDLTVFNRLRKDPKIDQKKDLPWGFESFQTLLGRARNHYGTSKHQPRRGRAGRSIKKSGEI